MDSSALKLYLVQLLGVSEADQAKFVQWSQYLLASYRPFDLDAYLGAQQSLLAIALRLPIFR